VSGYEVDVLVRTLLYEGYSLYPYRPSAVKNQQRFNFGVLHPEPYCAGGGDAWRLQTECLVHGDGATAIDVSMRFLQLIERPSTEQPASIWHEAIEREVSLDRDTTANLLRASRSLTFSFPAAGGPLRGAVDVSVREVRAGYYRITVSASNQTPFDNTAATRNDALLLSAVSAHVVLRTLGGDLISLTDPPECARDLAAACSNVGVWPVLVGDEGRRDCMLASPIILYDYPRIASESAGDLFDGTEIDEILALRILTLTEDEKREAREADERLREILDRTDSLAPEHWARLHGAVRGFRKGQAGTP
jgi:hypothetical protein